MPKKTREVWKLKEYNKCYCYERYGNVYTYVFGIKKATDFPWIPENKPKALQVLNDRINQHYNRNAKTFTLYDLLDDYRLNRISLMSNQSQKKLNEVFKWAFKFPDVNLDQTLQIRDRILKNFEKHTLANSTRSKYLSYIAAVFSYGLKNNYLSHNPINSSIIPKVETKKIKPFKPDEVEKILKHLKKQNRVTTYNAVMFSRYMGTRISETLSITWNNIKNGNVTFIRKGGKEETLPYSDFPVLLKLINTMPRTETRLFPITPQRASSQLKDAILDLNRDEKLKDKIDSTLSFHAIRKMRENEFIKKYKYDIAFTADWFGHSIRIQEKHYREFYKVEEFRENLKKVRK